MLTSTGHYISGNFTEQGRFAINNLTEFGEYAPTVTLFQLFRGCVVGGNFAINTTFNSQPVCGVLVSGASELAYGMSFVTSGGVAASGAMSLQAGYGFTASVGTAVGGTFRLPYNSECGMAVGGNCLFDFAYYFAMSGGALMSGSHIKKQMVFTTVTPTATVFNLVDASTNFKLEQQP